MYQLYYIDEDATLYERKPTQNTGIDPILELTKINLEIDAQLRETHGGNWEGKTEDENLAEDAQNFRAWLTGQDIKAGETGESRKEIGRAHV